MTELLFKAEVYALIGAAVEVYNVLGFGFLEAVYQVALEAELKLRNIPFDPQRELHVYYKGQPLEGVFYKPDFIIFGKIVVEIIALDKLTSREEAQLLNYLKATGFEAGVLINFGSRSGLEWKRMVWTKKRNNLRSHAKIPNHSRKFVRISG